MKYGAVLGVLAALAFLVAGCGGGKKSESDTGTEAANPQAIAACNGSPLKAKPKLPPSFPIVENTTFTRQSTEGPTELVEGYWKGSLKEAHDEYLKELKAVGYKILFDELEDHALTPTSQHVLGAVQLTARVRRRIIEPAPRRAWLLSRLEPRAPA